MNTIVLQHMLLYLKALFFNTMKEYIHLLVVVSNLTFLTHFQQPNSSVGLCLTTCRVTFYGHKNTRKLICKFMINYIDAQYFHEFTTTGGQNKFC